MRWRNCDLDRTSIEALLASLHAPPRARVLRRVEGAEDTAALVKLAEDPAIRARARGEEATSLLWDVCRIPDFRKLLLESHVALLAEIFRQLTGPAGALDADWMVARVAEIDDTGGDIDTLLARIASIRTWTYISNQARWIRDAAGWQARTRGIEDRLSDALHDRLVQRFVDRGAAARHAPPPRPLQPAASAPADPRALPPGHPFARLSALRAALAPGPAPASPPRGQAPWVEALIAAPHEAFSIDGSARIAHEGRPIAQLTRGASLLLPEVRLAGLADLGAGALSRVHRRVVAFARHLVEDLLAPLRAQAARELGPAGRGVVYQLEQGLGTALARDAATQIAELSSRDRELLGAMDVTLGEGVVYVAALLKPAAIERRAALCRAHFDGGGRVPCPRPGAVSLVAPRDADARAFAAIGYPVFGTRALRADVAERVRRALLSPDGDDVDVALLARWMGCPAREVPWISEALAQPSSPEG